MNERMLWLGLNYLVKFREPVKVKNLFVLVLWSSLPSFPDKPGVGSIYTKGQYEHILNQCYLNTQDFLFIMKVTLL